MSTQPIRVRATEPDDLAAVAEIFNQPLAIWGTLQVPFASLDSRRQRHLSTASGRTSVVALIEDKVIGTAGLHACDNPRRAHAASLGMAVHDQYAGRGAGTALMAALIGQADRWLNLRRLELTVWADNDRAIALYERFGFEREGAHRAYGWRDGGYVDAVCMARLRL